MHIVIKSHKVYDDKVIEEWFWVSIVRKLVSWELVSWVTAAFVVIGFFHDNFSCRFNDCRAQYFLATWKHVSATFYFFAKCKSFKNYEKWFYNTISLSCHEQVWLSGLRFERYFSHHQPRNVAHLNILAHDVINLLHYGPAFTSAQSFHKGT